ncbi:UDP-2,3-diacylglucosamine hydrolase [Legionella birminghamensis]|uniref:UDP-2,3-diacylglucosamine hydrolase n=1 Tax=Legionella birminghamensis TaxID=28083 RepID=A0A378IA01_9GAMM|nr:UDP-2,3-diacylglucosamine diphosphatase [Legionella birminghamensis]KTC69369.1 UDP-2,3-diacylglucosamine hydrolase [Legionella birminghamensis]STX31632.1 UDP-2,3-diacylglucosamine hydrolase [Legionella birminghamensis]
MLEAVFISDLHLHPDEKGITRRFEAFLAWISTNPSRKLFILGDFFHAWAGDDSLDSWSEGIAESLAKLTALGIDTFYMHGNRDFLIGSKFIKKAGLKLLPDPAIIELDGQRILLSHGDRYCTLDKAHQRFRRLTRNRLFNILFLSLPLSFRNRMVESVRQQSQSNRSLSYDVMDVVAETCIKEMQAYHAPVLIHGHTHKPATSEYRVSESSVLLRYVLSDWDNTPKFLCFDEKRGLEYVDLKSS